MKNRFFYTKNQKQTSFSFKKINASLESKKVMQTFLLFTFLLFSNLSFGSSFFEEFFNDFKKEWKIQTYSLSKSEKITSLPLLSNTCNLTNPFPGFPIDFLNDNTGWIDYDLGNDLVLTHNSDGTKSINGSINNGTPVDFGSGSNGTACGANDSWALDFTLSDKKTWTEWQAMGGDANLNGACATTLREDLEYWLITGTMTGTGCRAGQSIAVNGSDGNYRLQIGIAGNQGSTDCTLFGMSSWLDTTWDDGTNPPQAVPSDLYAFVDETCFAARPTASIFAIQPSCTDGVVNNDGYLQLSAVTNGDRINWIAGSDYTSGDTDYANATVIGALPFQFNNGLANPSGSQDYTVRVFNGASDCFTDYTVTLQEAFCNSNCTMNLLVNNDFEQQSSNDIDPNFPDLRFNVSDWQGWTRIVNNGSLNPWYALDNGASTNPPAYYNSQSGSKHFVGIGQESNNSNNGITQTFAVTNGNTYTVSFYQAPGIRWEAGNTNDWRDPSQTGDGWQVDVTGAGTFSQLFPVDVTDLDLTIGALNPTEWTEETFQFTATADGNATLSFLTSIPSTSTSLYFLDNVSVCEQAPAQNVCSQNTATSGTATASSEEFGGYAAAAIDGATTGDIHHSANETDPFWQVDLGSNTVIEKVVVYLRRTDRFDDAIIEILDAADLVIAADTIAGADVIATNTFLFGGVSGEKVRIRLEGPSRILEFFEVEVYSNTGPCPLMVNAAGSSCNSGTVGNDGSLIIASYGNTEDRVNYSIGSTYTGDTDWANADPIGAPPYTIVGGLMNPTGTQDYTVRVFSGSSAVFTDVTVTMNEVDCNSTCNCTEYVYLNETSNGGAVHKFAVASNGTLTEIGGVNGMPWFSSDDQSVENRLSSPHGLASDLNGNVYIGETSTGDIRKLDCLGNIESATNFEVADGGFNLGSVGNNIYVNSFNNTGIQGYDVCTGASIGHVDLVNSNGGSVTFLATDWGFYTDDSGTFYTLTGTNFCEENELFIYNPTDADFVANTSYTSVMKSDAATPDPAVGTVGILPLGATRGVTTDNQGNIYIVIFRGCGNTCSQIFKYSPTYELLAKSVQDCAEDGTGFYEAHGIAYSEDCDCIYVSTTSPVDDCVYRFDSNLANGVTAVPPVPSGGNAKGMSINRECCPTSPNIITDTTLCISNIGEKVFLQDVFDCKGTICEGDWTPEESNSGVTFDACENSIVITAANTCVSFTNSSDGLTTNNRCGAFSITLNMEINVASETTISSNQTICTNQNFAALTPVTSQTPTGYQWQSSTESCTSGFADISGATSDTYGGNVSLTETTYFRLISEFSGSGSCNNGLCRDTSNCVTITVKTIDLDITSQNCMETSPNNFTAEWQVRATYTNEPIGDMTYQRNSEAPVSITPTGSPFTFTIPNITADGGKSDTIQVYFANDTTCRDTMILTRPLPCPNDIAPCASSSSCLGGNVFEDFNCNGTDDTEPGVQGVEVQIYDCDNALVGTGYSDSDGDWQVCGLTDGTAYRVEFVLPESVSCWASPTHVSNGGNQSDVQFLTAPACTQFSVSNPTDYCQSNPNYFTTCFVPLDPITGANANEPMGAAAPFDANNNDKSALTFMPETSQTGSTYGVAWQPSSQSLFVSSYMKQTAGFGPDGIGGTTTGGIYRIVDDGTGNPIVSLFADLQNLGTGSDPHPLNTDICNSMEFGNSNNACWYHDVNAFGKVGKISLGDLELTPDGNNLITINLNERTLIKIPLGESSQNPVAGTPEEFDMSSLFNTCADASDWQPFGLGKKNGMMYLGAVCSAESTQSTNDLTGLIYEFDPNNLTNFQLIFSFALDYEREGVIRSCNSPCTSYWHPWTDIESELTFNLRTSNSGQPKADIIEPMPMLADIEFYGDDLIIGLRDRAADLFGDDAGSPFDYNSPRLYSGVGAGDILRAAKNPDGTYTLENNGITGTYTSAENYTGGTSPGDLNSGPGGKEFYNDGFGVHSELPLGGLAQMRGNDVIIISTMNPFAPTVSSAGVAGYDNTNGTRVTGNVYYDRIEDFDFGKSNGLGDIELMCDPAPLEIGNYVWCDSIQNGIQDACERGVDSLIVRLYDRNNALVGIDTTVNGNYYFNEFNVDTTGIVVDANGIASPNTGWTGMSYNTDYQIVFGVGQYQGGDGTFEVGSQTYQGFTTFNEGNNDNIDSDVEGATFFTFEGSKPRFYPEINMRTSATGCGDHKYDMGLLCGEILYSLGNQVFFDNDNSGDLNGTEQGIDGVQLRLLNLDSSVYDSDSTTAGIQELIVTTDNNGYYRFDSLASGGYRVEVMADNFTTGSILEGFASSTGANEELTPNSDGDNNDNGIDEVSGAIISRIVSLQGLEPTGENEPISYGAGSVSPGEAAEDELSNLTVDFGFFGCNISDADLTAVDCNDNMTGSNPADDYITFSLNPTGNGNSGTYNLSVSSGTITPTSASFGAATSFQLQNGSVGAGDVTVTITDAANSSCTLDVSIVDPVSCGQLIDYPDYSSSLQACGDEPCHIVSTDLYLGQSVSPDPNPTSGETADSDDDDGVSIAPKMQFTPESTVRIPVTIYNNTGTPAFLRMWIDWNGDGDFEDVGEQIEDNTYPSTGVENIVLVSVIVPANATQTSPIALRARLSTDDVNSATPCGTGTCAADGEIEDYLLQVDCPTAICPPVQLMKKSENP